MAGGEAGVGGAGGGGRRGEGGGSRVGGAGVGGGVARAGPGCGWLSGRARMPLMIIVAAGVFSVAGRDEARVELVVIAVATAVLFSLTRLGVGRQRTE